MSKEDLSYYKYNPQKNYGRFLKSPFWKSVRKEALETYGKACEVCGRTNKLAVHHANYDTVKQHTILNLTVLCNRCHSTTHNLNGSTPNHSREVCLAQLRENADNGKDVRIRAADRRANYRDKMGWGEMEKDINSVPGREKAAERREAFRQQRQWPKG